MELSARSMAAVWMVGIEDAPEHPAEICVFEVFGDALATGDDGVLLGRSGRRPTTRCR